MVIDAAAAISALSGGDIVPEPPVLDEVPEFVVGSLVRVGRGRKLWRVAEIWPDRPVATLKPVDGYSSTTVDIDRLRAVDEREAA